MKKEEKLPSFVLMLVTEFLRDLIQLPIIGGASAELEKYICW